MQEYAAISFIFPYLVVIYGNTDHRGVLDPFFPMLPFDPIENIRKPLAFYIFRGIKKLKAKVKG